jgi:hypothetical protein
MLHKGADHTTIAMHDQPARKPLSNSVNRVIRDDRLESRSIAIEHFNRLSGLLIHHTVDGAQQDAHRHLEPRTGVGRMRHHSSVATENRTDVGDA